MSYLKSLRAKLFGPKCEDPIGEAIMKDCMVAICSHCGGSEFEVFIVKAIGNRWRDIAGLRCIACGRASIKLKEKDII